MSLPVGDDMGRKERIGRAGSERESSLRPTPTPTSAPGNKHQKKAFHTQHEMTCQTIIKKYSFNQENIKF